MGKEHFEALGMLGTRTGRRALLRPDNNRRTRPAARDVANVSSLVDDLVKGHQHEVAPHDLHDGLHSHQCCTHRRTEDCAFGYGRVKAPIRTKSLLQTPRCAEDAPRLAHVFAIHQDFRTSCQFARQSFIDSLDVTYCFCLRYLGSGGGGSLDRCFAPHVPASSGCIRRRRAEYDPLHLVQFGLDTDLKFAKAIGCKHTGSNQLAGKSADRISCPRLITIFLGTVVLDVTIVMTPQARYTAFNQYWSPPFSGTIACLQDGVADDERV